MTVHSWALALGSAIAALLLRGLNATLRWQRLGRDRVEALINNRQRFAYATWHGSSVLLLPCHRDEPLSVLVSKSRDGDRAAALLGALGVESLRGSSSEGSTAALRNLCRASQHGRRVTLTVDGPRGPAGSVAPGIVALARLEGLWIVPVGAACGDGLQLRSWDRCTIPLPFSQAVMIYGRPFRVERGADPSRHCELLERQLAALHNRARRLCGARHTAALQDDQLQPIVRSSRINR